MRNIKFISYDGAYPNLCSGEIVLEVDGQRVSLGTHKLRSGGSCGWIPTDWTKEGPWHLERPEETYEEGFYEDVNPSDIRFTDEEFDEIERLVNENVEHGCCGGCI